MEKIIAKVKAQTTKVLKEMAERLMDDFRAGTDLIMDSVLDELKNRLDEKSFCEFCDNL